MDEQPHRRRRRRRHRSSEGDASRSNDGRAHEGRGSSSRHGSHRRRRSRRRSSRKQSNVDYRNLKPVGGFETWLVITVGYWLLLLFLMHAPGSTLPTEWMPEDVNDRWLHAAAFFGFGFLISRTLEQWCLRERPKENPPIVIYGAAFAVCVVYGYFDEATQPWTGRTNDAADWEADVIGAVVGVCLALCLQIFFVAGSTPTAGLAERAGRRGHRRRHRSKHRSDERRHRSTGRETAEKPASPPDLPAASDEPPVAPPPPDDRGTT
ncbi:MAG: VanZ family protein [Pirellulales bacterium]